MIRRFKVAGVIADDSKFIQSQETYRKVLINEMRDEGFVPLFDINPVWKTALVGGKYEFEYTMHGVHVGREKSWQSHGMMDGKLIPLPTQKSK
jgi:hypothetical protein